MVALDQRGESGDDSEEVVDGVVSGFGVDVGCEVCSRAVGGGLVVAIAEDGEVCDHLLHSCAGVSCDGVEFGAVAGGEDGCGVVRV